MIVVEKDKYKELNAKELTVVIGGVKYRTCPICGKIFEVKVGHRQGLCCSSSCRGKLERLRARVKSHLKIDTRKCPTCGKEFTVLVGSGMHKHGKFCSSLCRSKSKKEETIQKKPLIKPVKNKSGEYNVSYEDGIKYFEYKINELKLAKNTSALVAIGISYDTFKKCHKDSPTFVKVEQLKLNLTTTEEVEEKKEVTTTTKVVKKEVNIRDRFNFDLGYMICACVRAGVNVGYGILTLIKEYDEFVGLTKDELKWHLQVLIKCNILKLEDKKIYFANREVQYSLTRIETADGFIESILKRVVK